MKAILTIITTAEKTHTPFLITLCLSKTLTPETISQLPKLTSNHSFLSLHAKEVLTKMWTSKVQISLLKYAGWSRDLMFAHRKSIYKWIMKIELRLRRCIGWPRPSLLENRLSVFWQDTANFIPRLFHHYLVSVANRHSKQSYFAS